MHANLNPIRSPPGQRVAVSTKPLPRPPRRFRWYLVSSFLILLAASWIGRTVEPGISWEEFMDMLGVPWSGREGFTQTTALAVYVTASFATLRVLRGGSRA